MPPTGMNDRSPTQNRSWTVHTSIETETSGDTARIRRLTEFATDALDLADRRADLDLRRLIDDLYRDLIELEEDR